MNMLEDHMEKTELNPFPLGKKLRMPTYVVLNRASTTPKELTRIRKAGEYHPGPEYAVCELVAGGEVIAGGKLVKRSGDWYMHITEIAEET